MTGVLFADDISVGDALPRAEIKVTTKAIVMGATASRDWQPLHHDHVWAVGQGGLPSIIANNYTQSGWISRCITDACGPAARIARLRLRMRRYVCPGDVIAFNAKAVAIESREAGSRWVQFDVELTKAGEAATFASVLVALQMRQSTTSPWRNSIAPPPLKPSSM
jgi:acyl dehydratase